MLYHVGIVTYFSWPGGRYGQRDIPEPTLLSFCERLPLGVRLSKLCGSRRAVSNVPNIIIAAAGEEVDQEPGSHYDRYIGNVRCLPYYGN